MWMTALIRILQILICLLAARVREEEAEKVEAMTVISLKTMKEICTAKNLSFPDLFITKDKETLF
jgi:hypothetical protein